MFRFVAACPDLTFIPDKLFRENKKRGDTWFLQLPVAEYSVSGRL